MTTATMLILDQKLMIGPSFGVTVALLMTTVGIRYIDWRLRNNLRRLLRTFKASAEGDDYWRVLELDNEIRDGLSLTIAAKRLGELSNELGIKANVESPHV